MPLPAEILHAVSRPQGGQIVLVIGAGTSFDPPTCLPSSADCAKEAHRKLMADNILTEPCADPADLSLIADIVYETTGSQEALVRRLPWGEFLQAKPNEGHLLAAAMLVEGAIKEVLNLNYDLALEHALPDVGSRGEITVIRGPEFHDNLGYKNLIYLHGSANSNPDKWIMRSIDLNEAWRDGWENIIASMVLASPVVIFIGLGSPASVLTESIRRIRAAFKKHNHVFYISPDDPETYQS